MHFLKSLINPSSGLVCAVSHQDFYIHKFAAVGRSLKYMTVICRVKHKVNAVNTDSILPQKILSPQFFPMTHDLTTTQLHVVLTMSDVTRIVVGLLTVVRESGVWWGPKTLKAPSYPIPIPHFGSA